ncbi:hypothetical protein GI582_00725 [Sulfitobacter sp. BDSS02]|nr:hypothetical protein [Sulfitobacter sp. BDSS02]MBR9848136.1 hypothetical protein [Paracoccaceae bacterium]
MPVLQNWFVIVVAYVLAHGLTAMLITPLQSRFIPEITVFASLVYLPHGVRVLSTWLAGRMAFLPLFFGAFLAELLFTPADVSRVTDPVILVSLVVGASSALLAFELLRLLGYNLYAGRKLRIHWKWLLLVGMLASVINSIGQSLLFAGLILPERVFAVVMTYAIGDLIGLIVTTFVLMFFFRWIRLRPWR